MPAPYPHPTNSAVTAVMRGNKRTETRPEVRLRSELHRLGLRFRKDYPVDVGVARKPRPDIVFSRVRLAVFVDGCFWHQCPDHGRVPGGANAQYWREKLARNVRRDEEDRRLLESAGWSVIRIWEHELPERAAQTVTEALQVLAM